MTKVKENAVYDFLKMISHSWTYGRMTETEKSNCLETFRSAQSSNAIKGSYDSRWAVCYAIYDAYLAGIGYSGMGWRDKESAELVPMF